MGKITVETCGIEGLKIITPTVFGDERGYFMETYNYEDFREAGIDQVFVQDNQSGERCLMWLSICGRVLQLMESGLAFVSRRRIKSSFLSPNILPMDFLCYPIMRNLPINARTFIIPMMREAFCGAIRILGWSGRCRKAWS